MENLYIFSGLGADKRVFKYLDFSKYNATFIDWINPFETESIEDYAKRLTTQITSENPTLIGLSFGGIMAVEVGKIIESKKIILIASAKSKNEIPFYYRFAGFFNLHKLIPAKLMKKSNYLSFWFFGIDSKENKILLKEILKDTDETFLKWAIDKIVNWKNTYIHKNLKHIHGTKDRILPIQFVKSYVKIVDGGHFMTIDKFEELNIVLENSIKN
ncbi:alpha/beta hydrolase [Flavobacterium sp.]|uniref:alpha/beta hydrolase n=1 Tax=Flavobacterium sp. TaxID=239 RepID=UPI00261EA5ED|nr:alpha/beta hydrolase [Flavobacterium sp.]